MASSKCKNFEWNIETTKLLINLYKENVSLYNKFDPEYKNRDKRLSIMTNIAKLIQDTTGRICLVADIRKKINSLRSQYLAEKLKMTKCKSESGGDYIPTADWFPLLRFLDISTEADASQSNLDSQSPQADSDSMDIQQSREEEIEHPHKTKKKKKKLGPAEAGDADGLIKEATATMRQMSQHITSNAHTNSVSHITTFCNFVNSELNSILHASNNNFVKKAKRKIQMCLFDIWDEIDTGNMHEERPFTQYTNYSENSITSQNTRTSKSVVTGDASSIVIKRNDLLTYNSPQENDSVEICTEDEDNIQKSNEEIAYYINNYRPEDIA